MDNRPVRNANLRPVRGARASAHRRGGRRRIIPADRTMPQILGRTAVVLHLERRSPRHFIGKLLIVDRRSVGFDRRSGRESVFTATRGASFYRVVVLPLQVLTIATFKSSSFRELYSYRRTSRDYWAVWARQLGGAIQLTPLLMIPAVAIIQTCRYLNRGPPDIFDVSDPLNCHQNRVPTLRLLIFPSSENISRIKEIIIKSPSNVHVSHFAHMPL